MRVFFDTSALAKLFVPEAGTDEMNAMLAQDGMEIWVSALAPLEFHSLATRRPRQLSSTSQSSRSRSPKYAIPILSMNSRTAETR